MIITEVKKTLVEKEVDKLVVCDGCNVTLHNYDINFMTGKAVSYYEVTTHHHDWGNDSCDSFEHFDYCEECLPKAFEEYHKMPNKGSECFEVEHARGRVIKEL